MKKTTTASDNAGKSPPDSKTAIADPIPVALDFLRACHEERRPLALVTGAAGTGKSLLMHRFSATVDDGPVAHIRNAHNDPHAFLEELLSEFGFDAVESSVSDLIRLTKVFLLHEHRKGLRPVVIVENVDELGPDTREAIRELALPEAEAKPVSLFVLSSSAGVDALSGEPQFESVYSLDVTVRTSVLPDVPDCDTLEIYFHDRPYGLHRIEAEKTTIGRDGGNDVRVSGAFVSRFHTALMKESRGIYVVDLQSTNGTFVNGKRVTRRKLEHGDTIEIEEFKLKFLTPSTSTADVSNATGDSETLAMQAPLDHLLDQSA